MQKPTLSRTPLAAGVALALGAASYTPISVAQDDEVMEEIVTTGIRGSLMQSMDMKRSADGVVDAISAEDMGDFPDTNLAESLQRITGVSIDRERGEGARVTVRGFGPQFNLVTLNGRQMPTTGDNRNFDFGDLASEAVSAVEIYKSGRADVPTGGIGSTINIKTTKPLEAPGLKISFGASGVYDQSRTARTDTDWTGELSGIISNTFADDTIGVSLTLVRQERESGGASATVGGWRSFDGAKHISWGAAPGACDSGAAPVDITPYVGQEEWGGLPIPCFAWEGDNNVNRPEPGEIYSVPQTIGYSLEDYDRVRTNGQLTFQFRPIETVTATLDYTFADLELDRSFNDMSAWFNFGGQQTVWPADGNNLTPSTYSENSSGSDYSMGAGEDAFKNEDRSLGLNLMWDISDRLTVEFDYHDSKASNEPNSQWGSTALLSMAAYTRDVTTGYFEGQELPILELGLSSPLSPDDMQITGSTFQKLYSEMEIDQARLMGTLDFEADFIESIDFGVELTDTDYDSQFSNVQRNAWFAHTPIGALSDLLTPASMSGSFDEIDGSGDSRRQLDYFLWDMSTVIARAEDLLASGDMIFSTPGNGDLGPCGTALCPSDNYSAGYNRLTTEETQAAYVQVNASTEWGDFPVDLRLGLRYEKTDVTSAAEVPSYTSLVWTGGNEIDPISDGSSTVTSGVGDYDYLLPNFDVAIDFTDELVARFSYSTTLTRPNFVDLQGGVTIDSPLRIDSGTGARGNPALLPFESDNIDLSVEYYYGEASYASIGYFHKDVKNFIGRDEVAESVFDLPHPGLGPLADEARLDGATTPGEIRDWILVNRPDAEGVDVANDTITGVAGRDPSAVFDLRIPVNFEEATVDGWELNVQHEFWETGFGVIVNATFVDGDVGYDNNTLGAQFALSGLSDSANFIGYYENDVLGARLAYNWRDTFWAGNGQSNVGGGQPTYVDEYGQWDLNASYQYNENLQLFLDVINLTDETAYVYGRQKDQPLFAVQQGTRYNIGVRYKF